MALTHDEADAHVRAWEETLAGSSYPHRRHWPSRLFHHSPLENAVRILLEGVIRSRRDPGNALPRNIAGRGVIDIRDDAHNFVRFYFRPKTPTQFHIEGIRKPEECEEFGFQAPILIMLIFGAREILTKEGTMFSAENMQRRNTVPGENFEFFSSIPFDKVYHEGFQNWDHAVTAHRCAEVLARSPIELHPYLQWIYCRSEAERQTLIYKLGPAAEMWRQRIRVSDDIRVFNRMFTYVENVQLSAEGVIFELHPRHDGRNLSIKVEVKNQRNELVSSLVNNDFAAYPPGGKRWRVAGALEPGIYEVTIWLEDEEAFQAKLVLGDVIL
jgi:hypothetical protein